MQQSIRSRPRPWKTVILLCGKCARKLDGGFGPKGKDTLRGTLRSALKEHGCRRQVRIIESRCIGICPKKAVTALNASRPGTVLTVPTGTPADVVLEQLLGLTDHRTARLT